MKTDMRIVRKILRPILYLLSLLYGLCVAIVKVLTKPDKIDIPVISVGNITMGGTGKTPAVINILSNLEAGVPVAVISRGYKRKTDGIIVADEESSYTQIGDEARLVKMRSPGTMIVIGANRYECAKVASENGAGIIILDDGFQSYELERDLDIVLFDATIPLEEYSLLPAGSLREPPASISRADAVILNRSNMVDKDRLRSVEQFIINLNKEAVIFHAVEKIKHFRHVSDNKIVGAEYFRDSNVICFSGIGNPEGFYYLLRNNGARILRKYEKRDHYEWKRTQLSKIAGEASSDNIKLVTTEKDAARLTNIPELEYWILVMDMFIIEGEIWVKYINDIKK